MQITFKYQIFCFILALCGNVQNALAQPSNLGNPPVISYHKKTTNAGTQTWQIAEDTYGYTWFASNAGLIKFDGYNWELFRLPNDTKARSVAVDNSTHTIYTGGQGNFGYFAPDQNGFFKYTPLHESLGKKFSYFGDVWNIVVSEQGIFFRTDFQVFRYFEDKVTPLLSGDISLNHLGKWGNEIVLQDAANQLFTFNGGKFIPKNKPNYFNKGRISSVIHYLNDTILITTINNGIFYQSASGFLPWVTSDDHLLKSKIIYCAEKSEGGKILIGTSFTGLLIIDKNHRIETTINKNNGLQNNSVLSIHTTKKGNIWLGLDNGIDLVHLNSSFRQFYPDGELQGTGYSVALHKNKLFFGTNTGLYTIDWQSYYTPDQKNRFKLIPGTNGQVWKLQVIHDDLWMCHHDGAFIIKDDTTIKMAGVPGIWKIIELDNHHLIAGHYHGLSLFKMENNHWIYDGLLSGFTESSRIIHKDMGGNLWIAHPYRGIYLIEKDDIRVKKTSMHFFEPEMSSKIRLKNMVYEVGNKIIVSDDKNLFEINGQNFTLTPSEIPDNKLTGRDGIKFLIEDDYKNIWYGTNTENGLLIPEHTFETDYKKYIIKGLLGKLTDGHESVLTIDRENVIFPTDKGFLIFNPYSYIHDTSSVQLLLTKVVLKADKDSLLHEGNLSNASDKFQFNLPYGKNDIHFHFSVKGYPDKETIEYTHLLKGSDTNWTNWSEKSTLNFKKLAPGRYELSVKARNQSGIESRIININIHVAYPWYQSIFAYILYFILMIGVGILIIKWQKIKHETEKKKMHEINLLREKEHLINAELNKEEIMKLKNEKLEAEIKYKNQELTSFTYHLVTKNELISEIKKAINKLEPKFEKNQSLKNEFKNIIHLTEQNDDIDADWENFIQSFDQVHSDFFKRLNDEFNDLSPNDYKMCTYLRMNLTSKEIAALMNISIRSVETNRYRLRKKLGLHQEDNLTQFLLKY